VVPEFGSYCFHERVEQGTNKQLPIDRDNHGMDEVRYFAGYVWGNSHRARKKPEAPPSPYVVQIGPTDRQIKQAQRDEARRMSRSKYL